MAISIDIINISTNFLGIKTSNSDQRAIWSGSPLCPMWPSWK